MIVWRQSGWLLVGECFPLLVNIKCYTTSDPGNFMRNIFGKLHICTRRFHFHACTTNRFDINREGTWFFNRIRSTSCCCHRNQHIHLLCSVSDFPFMYPHPIISLPYFNLQWSDHRHSIRCACQLDFLPGVVFPGCAVPQRPGYPPQESHEEVPRERRGGSTPMSCCEQPLR